MSIRPTNVVFAIAFTLGLAWSASAQTPASRTPAAATTTTPTFELSAGYQFAHAPDQSFPFGLNVDGVRHFGSLGLVAEAGWAIDSDDDFTTHLWNFGVGPRWTGMNAGGMWPYAQVILGGVAARSSIEIAGTDISDTETAFMIQPGVGMTFVAGDGWGLFGQVDYRRTFFDEPDGTDDSRNNQFRFVVGVRVILD